MKKMNLLSPISYLALTVSSILVSTPYAEAVDRSGRTSHFWVTFSPKAGTSSAANSDITMRNGYREENGGASGVQCIRSEAGGDMLYDFTLDYNSFDGRNATQSLGFQVAVEAFANTTPTFSTTSGASALSLVGRAVSTVTDINNAWGVGNDNNVDANETLRIMLRDFTINGQSTSSLGYVVKDVEVIDISFKETNGGHTHKVVIGGVGPNQDSYQFNADSVLDLEGYRNPLYVTSAGSALNNREWAIDSITCKFRIVNPSLTKEDTVNYFSDTISGHLYDMDLYQPTVRFRRNQSFPKFSWDVVPRSLIVRKNTAWTNNELRNIADTYDLVILEKANNAGFDTDSQGMLDTAARLKTLNPEIKVVFYWNSLIYFGNYGINTAIENPNNFANWIDDELTLREGLPTYNWNNAGMRNWWIGSAQTMMANPQIDATFIDKGADTPDTLLDPLSSSLPYSKFLMGNFVRTEFNLGNRDKLIQTDGSYFERWKRDRNWGPTPGRNHVDTIATQIALMQEMADNDKIVMLKVDDMDARSPATMANDVDYELGIFLIGAGEYAYFSYQASVNARETAYLWETSYIDEFVNRLGPPKGLAARDGAIFTRSFQYADVTLDAFNQTANIVWK